MKSLICLESYWCSSSGVRFANAMWLFDLNTIIINSTGVKESMRALPLANCVSFNHEITAWKYENDFFFWGTSLKEMWDLFDMYIFYVVLCTPFYFFIFFEEAFVFCLFFVDTVLSCLALLLQCRHCVHFCRMLWFLWWINILTDFQKVHWEK